MDNVKGAYTCTKLKFTSKNIKNRKKLNTPEGVGVGVVSQLVGVGVFTPPQGGGIVKYH